MAEPIDVADIIAIQQLLSLYGHLVDEKEWDRLDELFTDDLVFDATDFGSPVTRGITGPEGIRHSWMTTDQHPLAHHATNVVVTRDEDGTMRVLSKGIGVGGKGRVGSVVYRDIVRKEAKGWRIAHRVATRRRVEAKPD